MKSILPLCLRFGVLLVVSSSMLFAASSNWTDTQGVTFKGEPKGTYGPFALFKTGSGKGRRVLFRTLTPEDCVRFYKETSGKYQRAADWSKGKSSVTFDLPDRVRVLKNDALVAADFKGKPEPELYVLLFASSWEGNAYKVPERFRGTYERLRRLYDNEMEAIYLGVRQDAKGDLGFAKGARIPWLVADYESRDGIEVYRQFAPEQGTCMVLVTREGIPLAVNEVDSIEGTKKFIDELCMTMAAGDEANSFFWKDRAYYLANTRPVQYATSSAPPLLVGNPLRASVLRKNQINQLSAKLEIDAQGNVTSAVIANKDAIKPSFAAALEKAFKTSFVFVPAIDQGKPVAASYEFSYTVPEEKQAMEADRDWILLSGRKEVAIPSWLVLRPIPVPAEAFSGGGAASTSAYGTDFFAKEGVASLAPLNGKTALVDGKNYTWERCEAKEGYVDLLGKTPADSSVGYAWTEFEMPNAGPAYLGLACTDGLKVWVNGNLVLDRWWQRSFQVDQDLIPIQLAAGQNTLLIKTQNLKDDWSFLLRVRR
ncbi:MAG: hypothetical protein QM715_08410 [Nibricoccus sp.]